MGKRGKRTLACKGKKITWKELGKRLDVVKRMLEEELKGADHFKSLPPMGECPVCITPFSRDSSQMTYMDCCGNIICAGCNGEEDVFEEKRKRGKPGYVRLCPFCRAPASCVEEETKKIMARASKGDVIACEYLAHNFMEQPGLEMNGLRYCIQSIGLGSSEQCLALSKLFKGAYPEHAISKWIKIDSEKATIFRLAAAIRGSTEARHECGNFEYDRGNHELGIRHWKIAAEAGMQPSLDALKSIYNGDRPGKEFIGKEDMGSIYRACHKAQMEVWSEQREKHRNICYQNDWKC